MKKSLFTLGCTLALGALASWPAAAQDSGALVDALVKKGVLTNQEGEEIRADLLKEAATTPAGKLNIASHVTQLKLYGDARFRYQATSSYAYTGTGMRGAQMANRDQMRYRVRIGADYSFTDNFKAGVRLETSANNDSTNNTFQDGYFKDGVFFGLYYLQWNPNFPVLPEDFDITVTGGKQKPTFFLDWANWDNDINPTGVSENFVFTGVEGFEFGANAGQYIYADRTNLANTAANPFRENDTWQLINQVYLTYTWAPKSSVTVAPALLNNVNTNGATDILGNTAGVTPPAAGTSSGERYANYDILYVPVEVKWNMWKQPFRAYYTYGHNFSADQVALYNQIGANVGKGRNEGDSHVLGLEIGGTKAKGDWMLAGAYIYREAYAADVNLVDSDWAQQAGNARGFVIRGGYAFTDFVTGNVSYLYSEPINKAGITPNGALNTNIDDTQVLQVDLSVKF